MTVPKLDGATRGRGSSSSRGRGARTNALTTSHGGSASTSRSSSQPLFSAEQWKTVAGIVGNAKITDDCLNGTFNNKLRIIDTCETHHVTGNVSWLFDTQEI